MIIKNRMSGGVRLLGGLITSLLMLIAGCKSQPEIGRFEDEVAVIKEIPQSDEDNREILLFTGSSSIKMWKDIQASIPEYAVINTGFGGSQMSDLLFYANDVIVKYHPQKVFIYEGDNDINDGVPPEQILETARQLSAFLKRKLPHTTFCFISAKPSPSRWQYKDQYIRFNQILKSFTEETERMSFLDIWPLMLNEKGEPRHDLFLDDMLHMNEKGYEIWVKATRDFLFN